MYLGLGASDRQRLEKGLAAVVDEAGGSFPLTVYGVLITASAVVRRASRARAG